MARLLIIEDDRVLNRGVCYTLKKDSHQVYQAYSIKEGRAILEQKTIDFLLLDINLPDGSGLDFCQELKQTYSFPIVFFTANDTEVDMIKGFAVGCDDYLAKPFSVEVLKHKVQAMLRRKDGNTTNRFVYKDLELDFDRRLVMIRGETIKLTAREYQLLYLFVSNLRIVLTKEMLLEKMWDTDGNYVDENTLSVTIRRLRKKIEGDVKNPVYIQTVFGVGYVFGEA